MNKDQIEIGSVYLAKVGSRSVEVRIDSAISRGGWNATSLATNKPIRIKDVRHLKPAKNKMTDAAVAPIENAGADESPVVAPNEEPSSIPDVAALDSDLAPAVVDETPAAADDQGTPSAPEAKAPEKAADKSATQAQPGKGMSCLDAAEAVLKAQGRPLRCQEMIDLMKQQGLWSTTAPTPHATLYSAILREISSKGSASRFRKAERGLFELAGA